MIDVAGSGVHDAVIFIFTHTVPNGRIERGTGLLVVPAMVLLGHSVATPRVWSPAPLRQFNEEEGDYG